MTVLKKKKLIKAAGQKFILRKAWQEVKFR